MMDRLPREVIVNILSKLPLTSLLNSKLVCRAWRTLIQDPFLISKHSDEADGNDPSFILESNWPIPGQRFFIDFSDHGEGKVISKKLPGFHTSMHLGLRRAPQTGQSSHAGGAFGFRFSSEHETIQGGPDSGSTKIAEKNSLCSIGGSDSNHRDPLLEKSRDRTLSFYPSISKAFVNGRLHWLTRPNKYTKASLLISFDLETEQFREVPKADCCCASDRCFRQLTVVRGSLSAGAFHGDDERFEIWVMKEYGVKESWIKEFSIGTHLPPTLMAQREIRHLRYSNPNLLVRVLCVLKSGEILLEYLSSALVLYDPQYGTFKEFRFLEMPSCFKIVIHVGSLSWLHS
ncbi:hypothetical protein F3Y22_tig00111005pilonHSYRG00009 [Hibiscus syriacus]|uniref:F-box domain-containing protein n=1 Tax=Hibiscus syriacus TaxID=106335 RepID=A0A6A2Z7R0_HIBSY|nr:F-box protein At3g07870-like [Hibiscus syriacus]KAE8687928.1 hypothetical protein F3Y22_tig00111005pilonHSYRG00009 [Hibiscus syriacus]